MKWWKTLLFILAIGIPCFLIGIVTASYVLGFNFEDAIKLGFITSPWFTLATTVATIVIACYAAVNYALVSRFQVRDQEFRDDIKKLYIAIVLSNMFPAELPVDSANAERSVDRFVSLYNKVIAHGDLIKALEESFQRK